MEARTSVIRLQTRSSWRLDFRACNRSVDDLVVSNNGDDDDESTTEKTELEQARKQAN